MEKLTLTYLGRFHAESGDLFTMTHPNGNEARVFVDSLGETWVDIRRVPEGGVFHTERVEGYRVFSSAYEAGLELAAQGFGNKRNAPYAHLVRELGI